ncbi:uncharacterized protein LOC114520447 [Dendronephthya gigantea]|uniref:uncharacterized protein LOC114520447 n=1 Tax=Dendronephthya gigantea TaxID=151771 RepID=UPI0010693A0B|nr:uncharacterized protein LOC114520447 [Dendronephthya gigantea]
MRFSVFVLLVLCNTIATKSQDCKSDVTFNDEHGSFKFSSEQAMATNNSTYRNSSWKIEAPLGKQVDIMISSLRTATCTNASSACTCTYLAIKDGECYNSTLIGKYCGTHKLMRRLSSSGRFLRIEFVSKVNNRTRIMENFTVDYFRVTPCSDSNISSHKCPNRLTKLSHKMCCVSNGKPSCCPVGGNNCTDKHATKRSYCPGPQDDNSKTECCMDEGQPICCEEEKVKIPK